MSARRRRALRAVLSALAGGGLTAASLGGPLAGSALGETVSSTGTSPEGPSTPVTAANSGSTAQELTAGGPSNTTQTTPSTSTSGTSPAPHLGTSSPAGPSNAAPEEAPAVVLQRRQRITESRKPPRSTTSTQAKPKGGQKGATGATGATGPTGTSGPNNVALPPQVVAGQAGALAAALASSAASVQALSFYRIPLFLLPIYQEASLQYGVPWQILAAINEIETNYGSDQSVSTAGAVGWMQFMPATWTQYGVDAVNAGYADPYNPVDAIFAAARYLRAAGAAKDLRGAILAYNHSDEYANSVLLRAKLISTYPEAVIATLTGLVDDRPPVTGKRIAWGAPSPPPAASSQSATANAVPAKGAASIGSPGASAGAEQRSGASQKGSPAPGATAPPSPTLAAALATGKAAAAAETAQLVDLVSSPNAVAVAVQDGRIVKLGASRKLGKFVILRDLYGDVFTYAGLGSIAPSYRQPRAPRTPLKTPVVEAPSANEAAPTRPASAGRQLPLTLRVGVPKRKAPARASGAAYAIPTGPAEPAPAGMGRVRLFAHPGNPDARAAARSAAAGARAAARTSVAGHALALRRGSVVAAGTALGHVRVPPGATEGHLRFGIRPAEDPVNIDPRAILRNWVQLDAALHPRGAKGESSLLGATANEVFLLPKSRLEREVLSDPGIVMSACSRNEVGSGLIDRRALAVLAFLSRSGLKPTVGTFRCEPSTSASPSVSADHIGDAVTISQIDGIPVAAHQGSGSITDLTIRALLTLRGEFLPERIISLMQYPNVPVTLARPDHAGYIEIAFPPAPTPAPGVKVPASKGAPAHSAGAGQTAPSPLVVSGELSVAQWDQLIARIAALPAPTVSTAPSSSAIRDPKRP